MGSIAIARWSAAVALERQTPLRGRLPHWVAPRYCARYRHLREISKQHHSPRWISCPRMESYPRLDAWSDSGQDADPR